MRDFSCWQVLMSLFWKINPSYAVPVGLSALLLLPALPPRTRISALFWALPWRPRPRKVRPFGDPRRSREGRRLSSRYRLPPPEPPAGAAPRLCRYPLRQESRWREIRATASHANHTTPHHTICYSAQAVSEQEQICGGSCGVICIARLLLSAGIDEYVLEN